MDRSAIDDMAKLMALLEGKDSHPAEMNATADNIPESPISEPADPQVAAMKAILERFNHVGDVISEGTMTDPDLAAAMVTEATPTGARVGDWEIRVNEQENGKSFDVLSVATGAAIAKDLLLYEAALGITKLLNRGVTINDGRVSELLRLEEEFAKNRSDAVHLHRHAEKMIEQGDDFRAGIAEDRLDVSRQRAVDARDRILRLAGLR